MGEKMLFNSFSPRTNFTVSFPQNIKSVKSAFVVCGSVCMNSSESLQTPQFHRNYGTYSPLDYCYSVAKTIQKMVAYIWCLGISSGVTLCIFECDLIPSPTSVSVFSAMLLCAVQFTIFLSVYQSTNHSNLMVLCNSCWAKLAFFFFLMILLRDAS